MLGMICKIPENIGWVIVGAFGALTLVATCCLGEAFIEMWEDRRTENKSNANC